MLFYCDHRKFNLTGGFFIFLFMVTGREMIFTCNAVCLWKWLINIDIQLFVSNCLFVDTQLFNCAIIANCETAVVLELLEGLFSGLNWGSDQKVSEPIFSGRNWTQNPQICPKSISLGLLIVESWLMPQNDCKNWFIIGVQRYVYYPSDNRRCP